MSVLNYYTVNGEIIGEKGSGTTRRDYLTDGLGSVVGTTTSTGTLENSYVYSSYGRLVLATRLNATDPFFRWVGSLGYRHTAPDSNTLPYVYVRARHYDDVDGRWTTKDPLRDNREANQY